MRWVFVILLLGLAFGPAGDSGFAFLAIAQTPEPKGSSWVKTRSSPATSALRRPQGPASAEPLAAPDPAVTGNRFYRRAMQTYAQRADQKNHWKAARFFFKLARKFPADREIQIWCARTALYCALRIEHADTTISVANWGETCANRVVEKNPDDYAAGILLVRNRLVAKRASGFFSFLFFAGDARDSLELMLKAYPGRFEAYQVLGELYVNAVNEPFSFGDSDKGIALLEQGRAYAGEDAEYHYVMGVAYAAAGQTPAARVNFKRCLDNGTPRMHLDWETTFFKERSKEFLGSHQ